jgi:hypothetical protein
MILALSILLYCFSAIYVQPKKMLSPMASHFFSFFSFFVNLVDWQSSTRGMSQIWLEVRQPSKTFLQILFSFGDLQKHIVKMWRIQIFSPKNMGILVFFLSKKTPKRILWTLFKSIYWHINILYFKILTRLKVSILLLSFFFCPCAVKFCQKRRKKKPCSR